MEQSFINDLFAVEYFVYSMHIVYKSMTNKPANCG